MEAVSRVMERAHAVLDKVCENTVISVGNHETYVQVGSDDWSSR